MSQQRDERAVITPAACRCGRCTPTRRVCWSCCVCGQGPFSSDPRGGRLPYRPPLTRTVLGPGGIRGVAYEMCGEACKLELDRIGVPAIVTAPTPPVAEEVLGPEILEALPGLTPGERAHVARIAEARSQSVGRFLVEVLDGITRDGTLEAFWASRRGTPHEAARPAESAASESFDRLPIEADTRGSLRSIAAEHGVTAAQVMAETLSWYLARFTS